MDSFELNKILGAILGTLVLVMGVGFIADAIYAPIEGRGPGYALPEPEQTAAGPVEEAEAVPIAVLLASASVDAGAQAARQCGSCHTFGEGEGHRTGPNLWDTVGAPVAGHEGYAFSDVLEALGQAGETWTFENLDAFLESPRNFAPGTRMTYAGMRNPADRANLIAYMATLSDDPVPLPEVTEEEPAEAAPDEAPAGDVEAAEEIIPDEPADAAEPIPGEDAADEPVEPVETDAPAPSPTETQETLQPGAPDDPEPVTLPGGDADADEEEGEPAAE